MLSLQKLWNGVLESRDGALRSIQASDLWKKPLADSEKKLSEAENSLKSVKTEIKDRELVLAGLEEKVRNLNEKSFMIKTEKDAAAYEADLAQKKQEISGQEEMLLELMDAQETAEKNLAEASVSLKETQTGTEKSLELLSADLLKYQTSEKDFQQKYNEGLPEISVRYRARFDKLVKGKKGKAVGPLNGEICSLCNCQIPASLALEAAKETEPVLCTNCGCFIYVD